MAGLFVVGVGALFISSSALAEPLGLAPLLLNPCLPYLVRLYLLPMPTLSMFRLTVGFYGRPNLENGT